MSEAETDKNYVVSGIYERDRHLLEFLDARGIRPGVRVELVERNYDQTLSVRTSVGLATLGRLSTERIWLARTRAN
jgi:hypothetical protein